MKNKLTVIRGVERWIIGEGPSRNMYKGPMGKDNGRGED